MTDDDPLHAVRTELEAGLAVSKCRKCGCMREALDALMTLLPQTGAAETEPLAVRVADGSKQMQPIQYACLGCSPCYAAEAQNAFAAAFPAMGQAPLACDFQVQPKAWPAVPGEYSVLDPDGRIAITTLGNAALAKQLADQSPKGLALVGKTETENIGIDKIVKNIITNCSIQYLVVAGHDPVGHLSGKTLLALSENGVDANGRVIGSPGKRPVLRNVSAAEIQAFREQVRMIDLIGCEEPEEIISRLESLSPAAKDPCG